MVEGGSEFYKIVQNLAKNPSFIATIARLPENEIVQKGDEELVLRFFAVKNFFDGYHGNVQEWLDAYMEGILFGKVEFDEQVEREIFLRTFEVLHSKFGADAFARRRDGQALGRLAPAYFEAVVGATFNNIDAMREKPPEQLEQALAALFESAEFRGVTGPGANTIEKLRGRIQLVSECFQA